MNCPKCDSPMLGADCSCGYTYQEKARLAVREFVFTPCAIPGCGILLRHLRGTHPEEPRCNRCVKEQQELPEGWHQQEPVYPEPQREQGPEIGLDEFGRQLFETIKTIGSIAWYKDARQHTHLKHIKPKQLTEWQHQQKKLTVRLAGLLDQLSGEELAQVLEKYPWILGDDSLADAVREA